MSFLRFQGEGALCPFPLIVWSGCWVWCCECRRVVRPAVCADACCASRRCFCAGACSDPPCARCLRAPAAPLALLAVPGVRGCAPLPPDPSPRQAELAGFCALRARAALRAGGFVLAHAATRLCVLAHASTRRVRAAGALPPRRSRCSRSLGAGATRPYPRTPTRGKLSLQAFARSRARAVLRAGVSVLAHGATLMFVLAHAGSLLYGISFARFSHG